MRRAWSNSVVAIVERAAGSSLMGKLADHTRAAIANLIGVERDPAPCGDVPQREAFPGSADQP